MHCVHLISSPSSAAASSACVGSHTAPDRGEPDQPHHVSLTATDGSGEPQHRQRGRRRRRGAVDRGQTVYLAPYLTDANRCARAAIDSGWRRACAVSGRSAGQPRYRPERPRPADPLLLLARAGVSAQWARHTSLSAIPCVVATAAVAAAAVAVVAAATAAVVTVAAAVVLPLSLPPLPLLLSLSPPPPSGRRRPVRPLACARHATGGKRLEPSTVWRNATG